MKFSQYTWNLYKQSPEGKLTIQEFEDAPENAEVYDLISKYNPTEIEFIEKELFENTCEILWCYGVSENEKFISQEDAKKSYEALINLGIRYEGNPYIPMRDYKTMLAANSALSILFFFLDSTFFFPNLFKYRFFDLNKIADTYEIELPPIPKKSDYKARCMYYWELCDTFYQFRIENNLSPAELCAFLYDYAPGYIKSINKSTPIPEPSQAWFIGGIISPEEKELDITFWQANPDTKKGDILVHYETSPISAITSIWIAQTDGVIDPFFHYYSSTYIGNRIDIPNITLGELQADEYFSVHPLIRKKFQGVNGWVLSSKDYTELFRILKSKGFNTDSLPTIYIPSLPIEVSISNERDIETQLLEPFLNTIGLQENKDFIRQLPTRAGRGHRIFPDYAVHYMNKECEVSAKVLIEAKFHMKNNKDIQEAFLQARSYANLLESSTIILCDKDCLIIYVRKESFDRDRYTKIYWSELGNSEKYNELKTILKK